MAFSRVCLSIAMVEEKESASDGALVRNLIRLLLGLGGPGDRPNESSASRRVLLLLHDPAFIIISKVQRNVSSSMKGKI